MALLLQDILPGNGGATTQGTVPKQVPGARTTKRMRITGSGAYVTGGYALTPQNFGFGEQIDYLDIVNELPGATASYWYWNTATQKLQLIVTATGAELGNGQNDGAAAVDVIAYGY